MEKKENRRSVEQEVLTMRPIDGDALYNQTAEWENRALNAVMKTMNDEDKTEWEKWSTILAERSAFKFDVADAPTVDAVPVVRCRDCKWYGQGSCHNPRYGDGWANYPAPCVNEEYYCADGERKGGNE